MEITLVLLKPDCLQKRKVGEVIGRFEKAGFEICGAKMLQLSPELLQGHYAHITHLPVFPDLSSYMQSSPVIALAVQGEGVIQKVRELVGPTDSRKAPPGTIRGDLGESSMKNVVHASDSPSSAAEEIKRFFKEGELFAW